MAVDGVSGLNSNMYNEALASQAGAVANNSEMSMDCLLYTSPSPRD